jgi:hypothetical protein
MRVKSKMVFQMEREHLFSPMGKSLKWNLRKDKFGIIGRIKTIFCSL